MNFPKEEVKIFLSKVNSEVNKELPSTLLYNNEKVIAKRKEKLNEANFKLFLAKRTKEKYRTASRNFEQFVKAYLISGDKKYLDE